MKYLFFIPMLLHSLMGVGQIPEHISDRDYLKANGFSAAVTHEVTINRSQAEVWKTVSHWGDAYLFTPGLDSSYSTSSSVTGPDSKRHCDIGKGSVEEDILRWNEGEGFVLRVYEMDNIPMMKQIEVQFDLHREADNRTRLTYTMAYKMPMGKLMKGTLSKNIKTNAYSVKHYIETGDAVTAKDAKKIQKLYF